MHAMHDVFHSHKKLKEITDLSRDQASKKLQKKKQDLNRVSGDL